MSVSAPEGNVYNEQVPKYSETPTDVIRRVAGELGVPEDLALAIAEQESGFDPKAAGDGGHSIGLFQLNDRGEGAGMSVAQREDPETNARIALTQVANVLRQHPDWDYGKIAAAAQRPEDQVGYAASINSKLKNGIKTPAGTITSELGNSTPSGAPVLDEQSLASEYGFAASFFSIDPELQGLIQQATSQQWTPQQFTAKFQATKWYGQHSQNVRDFLTLQKTDQATFQETLDRSIADVKGLAGQMGAELDDGTLKELASNAMEFGWDKAQVQQALSVHIGLNGGGQAAANLESMRKYVQDQGVYMSDGTIQSYLRGIGAGTSTIDTFQSQVRNLAASAFPQYAQQIQAGQTVKDIADPYVQDMSAILEVNPSQVSVFDPTIRKALSGAPDKNGQPTATGLWQFEQNLRQDPRWQYTKNATDAGYSLLHTIGKNWGFES